MGKLLELRLMSNQVWIPPLYLSVHYFSAEALLEERILASAPLGVKVGSNTLGSVISSVISRNGRLFFPSPVSPSVHLMHILSPPSSIILNLG